MSFNAIRLFIKLSRPFFLLGAVLVYALGVGIARYLGVTVDWGLYFLGQAWVTTLQLATHYFNEYFDSPADAANNNRTLPRVMMIELSYRNVELSMQTS